MTAQFIMLSPFTWGTEDPKLQALQGGRTKRGAALRNDCFVRITGCNQGWRNCLSVTCILENGHHSAPMVVSVSVPEHMAHFWFLSHFQLTWLAQVLFWSVRSETDVGYISFVIWGRIYRHSSSQIQVPPDLNQKGHDIMPVSQTVRPSV